MQDRKKKTASLLARCVVALGYIVPAASKAQQPPAVLENQNPTAAITSQTGRSPALLHLQEQYMSQNVRLSY
jgi:hypothetical protein